MSRILNKILNTSKCKHSFGIQQQLQNLRCMGKRNFGVMTQTRNLDHRNEHKIVQHHSIRRWNSSEASAVVSAANLVPEGVHYQPGFFESFYQSVAFSPPVDYMKNTLIQIHDYTGLPWWASIVVSTIVFRSVVTLPLIIYQHKIMARLEKITLEMPAIAEELKKEATLAMHKFHWTNEQTNLMYKRSLKKQWNNLVVRENCHPAKTFIVLWAQIPLWVFQSMALRNMIFLMPDPNSLQAQIVATEMSLGGFGWIPNMTVVDSSLILPVALGIINLSIIEIQSMLRTRPSTRFQNITTNVFRVLSILMVPVACTVPSGLTLYWVASSSYGLAQNLIIASPKFKRAVGIPKIKAEIEKPYEHLWMRLKQRIGIADGPIIVETKAESKIMKENKVSKKS